MINPNKKSNPLLVLYLVGLLLASLGSTRTVKAAQSQEKKPPSIFTASQNLPQSSSGKNKDRKVQKNPELAKKPTPSTSSVSPVWIELKACTLMDHPGNDGDSFHVDYKGTELVIRLYMVDTPETKYDHIERILKQMYYFNTNHEKIIQTGEISKEYTKTLLKSPFTVYTKKENALGSGADPRIYGFILNSNKKDVGELLIAEGLARSYGKSPAGGSLNPKLRDQYDALEKQAKRNKIGIWSRGRTLSLSNLTNRQLGQKAKTTALVNSQSTIEKQSAATDSLIKSIKAKEAPNSANSAKAQNSKYLRNNTIFATSRVNTDDNQTITKEELDILLPQALEIDGLKRKK